MSETQKSQLQSALKYFRVTSYITGVVLLLVMVPFWTSFLIRTYAWIIVLGNRGFVNGSLMALGIIDAPIPLLFTRLGVVVALAFRAVPS